MWDLPVIPLATLLLSAALFATPRRTPNLPGTSRARRVSFTVAALAPIGLLAFVLASTSSVEQSRADARAGSLSAALQRAVDAHAVDPNAATPLLQSALVREQAGNIDGATADAREAASREPDNWRTWYVLSRLEAKTGHSEASVAAFTKARDLNPKHPVFR